MKVLYHLPNPDSVYAVRTIAAGYQHAFIDEGHQFQWLTATNWRSNVFDEYRPDVFMTSLSPLSLKYLDMAVLKRAKQRGTRVLVNVPFWQPTSLSQRWGETASLQANKRYCQLLQSADYGDVYYNSCEQGDERMAGFARAVGKPCHTVLLAADATLLYPEFDATYGAHLSFIGTNLPGRRAFFEEVIGPLRSRYLVRVYGQDWTRSNQLMGVIQKCGQYFNLPVLKTLRSPALPLSAERKIYSSSLISLNVHEDYQRHAGDLNERTFKIPLAGGFEIVDDVASLHRYFSNDELVVATTAEDWWDKIQYYCAHPCQRLPWIARARRKVLAEHTYHHRVRQLLHLSTV